MDADTMVLVALLVVHFAGLLVVLLTDPAHLLDAWKANQR